MITIEPCCAHKHWRQVLHELETSKTVVVNGYGDMTLSELLPVMLERYSEAEVMLAVPTLPGRLQEALTQLLRKTWAVADGGNVPVVGSLQVITDARDSRSPGVLGWMEKEAQGGRLTMASSQQNDTLVAVGDLLVMGPVNVLPCGQWTAIVTRDALLVAQIKKEMEARLTAFRIGGMRIEREICY